MIETIDVQTLLGDVTIVAMLIFWLRQAIEDRNALWLEYKRLQSKYEDILS